MCGIAGFMNVPFGTHEAIDVLRSMGDAIAHRGPDGRGEWFDCRARVGLVHRRLAIVDLSAEGAQPMHSVCGRYTIVFNGEIYNYRALRVELEQVGLQFPWRGHSDTEIILASIVHWGFIESLSRFNGMFAIALWDSHSRKLFLARDRFGEKPLYYGWHNGSVLFGSELKAIRSFPNWKGRIDSDAVRLYLQYCYVPAPRSIYTGICKLPPGSWIGISVDAECDKLDAPNIYWSALDEIIDSKRAPLSCSVPEMVSLLDAELNRSVALRMHSDVPLGVFLSGGVDSALVTAIMQAQSSEAVRSFSLGFSDLNFDESSDARKVAKHLGTIHTDFIVSPQEMLSVVPKLPKMYDEPFADSSQIPTHLVAQLARQHVTVALTGDAGDELFGGYNRHVVAKKLQQLLMLIPGSLRGAVGNCFCMVPVDAWDNLNATLAKVRGRPAQRLLGHKMHKFGRALGARSRAELYRRLVSFWISNVDDPFGEMNHPEFLQNQSVAKLQFSEQMMAADLLNYLPDDILVKVDRATMAVGLESRIPFLDPNVFSLAWRIPIDAKIAQGVGKSILRKVLYRYVPPSLVNRPKSGFGIPLGNWLRGPLREWAESYLTESALSKSGLIDAQLVRQTWVSYLAGHNGFEYHIWAVLMLQAWLENEAIG